MLLQYFWCQNFVTYVTEPTPLTFPSFKIKNLLFISKSFLFLMLRLKKSLGNTRNVVKETVASQF